MIRHMKVGFAKRSWSSTAVLGLLALSGCASEHGFQPAYLPEVEPRYLTETEIVILMHDHDLEYVYEGKADSFVGETLTLRMPLGAIMKEVAGRVFQSHFMYGVVFTQELVPGLRYDIAIEPEIRNFAYRYEQYRESDVLEVAVTEEGIETIPVSVITPSIQFELAVKVYDAAGNVELEKLYPSGVVEGESYIVTSRPHERVNATFHTALQNIMLEVADDIRPFLLEAQAAGAGVGAQGVSPEGR
jgi:hypothetical protein